MAKDFVPGVKGTRDFYPEDKAFLNCLYEKMKKVSELFGYVEYDGPEIEYFDLYAQKTSEEILQEEAFTLYDRDGRVLLLRPELTPTFARMVAQRSHVLLKPIRWWCFGRAWRYEKPQRGRGREFFQWELNILGPETPEADAEIFALLGTFFQELGLTPDEVVVRVNDRSYFEQTLVANGINRAQFMPLLRIVDRKEKVSPDEFDRLLAAEGLSDSQIEALHVYFSTFDFSRSFWLSQVFAALSCYGDVAKYFVYDPTIARGFNYYTRTVFEAWDKTGRLRRAVFGGGRFDDLTAVLGGERVPGMGFAVGDMTIAELLSQFGKKPVVEVVVAEVLVTVFDDAYFAESLRISSFLRGHGIRCECWTDGHTKLEKQLKYAHQKGIRFVVIVGSDEVRDGVVVVKDLRRGKQERVLREEVGNWVQREMVL